MLFDDLNKTSQKFEKLQNSVYLMQLLPVARITLYAGSLYIYIYHQGPLQFERDT